MIIMTTRNNVSPNNVGFKSHFAVDQEARIRGDRIVDTLKRISPRAYADLNY